MRVHVTCSTPTRSLVLAVHAVRQVLVSMGHQVSVSWPEPIELESGAIELGFNTAALARADVVVHACPVTETELPAGLDPAVALGKPIVRFVPGAREAGAPLGGASTIACSVEEVPRAMARAAALTVE
jgi:hypothetical protein